MKVAILSCFHPYRGGIAQFNSALLTELGKTCEVKAFNFIRQYPSILFPGKTQYVTPDDEASEVESIAVLDSVRPSSYVKTWKEIYKWGPDLVIVRYWMSFLAPSLGYVTRQLKKHGITVISILDNVIPHERHFFDGFFTRYFLKGSNACITLCDAVAGDLKKIRPDLPCAVLPHPLYSHFGQKQSREESLRSLGLDPSRKTLLFFGLIREYKGLDILLDAFADLDESYQLIIAGEPYGSFEKYEEKIKSLKPGKAVATELSYIRDSQVSKYFSGADLCVLPYRSATQSGVSAVSFHFEVPMLVTDVGGLKETIYDTGCGLLAGEVSAEAVRKSIELYFSDAGIKEKCISSIKVVKDRLSWSRFASNLLDFYRSL